MHTFIVLGLLFIAFSVHPLAGLLAMFIAYKYGY
jgi:p-aminobenzoyl-glutamate transporter AbgT